MTGKSLDRRGRNVDSLVAGEQGKIDFDGKSLSHRHTDQDTTTP